jgi:hypothetical protein
MEYHINYLAEQGVTEVPIWQQKPADEAVEGLTDVTGDKVKQLKDKQLTNLRRKSSNFRGDLEGPHLIGEHDAAGIPSSKLEQVSILINLHFRLKGLGQIFTQ